MGGSALNAQLPIYELNVCQAAPVILSLFITIIYLQAIEIIIPIKITRLLYSPIHLLPPPAVLTSNKPNHASLRFSHSWTMACANGWLAHDVSYTEVLISVDLSVCTLLRVS